MRGDGVGVGDVGEVPCGTRISRDATGGDYGRGSRGKPQSSMVGARWWAKHDEAVESCSNRLGIDDGARGEHGAGGP